jgi:lysozyme
MKTSPRGAAFIAAHEGIVTRAYKDVAGVWTIGVGHTASAGPPKPVAGMTISRAEANAILARDLARFERRVTATLGAVPQSVFDGAVSFDFNTGAIHRASWVKAYRAGDANNARRQLMQWVKAGGRRIGGLVRRREAEARLIFAGDYGPSATAAGGAAPPAAADVRRLQGDLAALGFHAGPADGIDGPRTRAAIIAYQRSHPDLVADGIAGPATLTSLARDLAARRRAGQVAGAAAAASATAGAAALQGGGGHPLLLAAALAAAVLVAAGGAVAFRYRGVLKRLIRTGKGA